MMKINENSKNWFDENNYYMQIFEIINARLND